MEAESQDGESKGYVRYGFWSGLLEQVRIRKLLDEVYEAALKPDGEDGHDTLTSLRRRDSLNARR